jgi:K+-sensing histidine kinase KdpD
MARILVVDDEAPIRRSLQCLLAAEGHDVFEAEDGAQALAAVDSWSPDVVLLDVMMPRLDGLEVCRRLKANPVTAPIPVLLVTGLSEKQDRLQGIKAGANDFLTKPIDPQEAALRTRNAVFSKRLHDRVRESYERLKDLEELRDDLTHLIVHDLRSPLAGIKGYLDLLRLGADELDEDKQSYINDALGQVSTLMEMISSLLDVNRLESGELPLDMKESDLAALTAEAIGALGELTTGRSVKQENPHGPINVNCDTDIICRVVATLVGNALRLTTQSDSVVVSVQNEEGIPRVEIRDTGPGIPPEYLEEIFDKYGQVAARKKRRKYSVGYGLTFCKLAVEAHGGIIGVESEVGKGSTFWFELPG